MGLKLSKPQLQRKKSLSTLGRSSQRNLFQKTKAKLRTLEKKIESQTNHDEIRAELENIEKELMGVSAEVKEKNKEKYEDVVGLFVEIKDKVKVETVAEEVPKVVDKTEEDATVAVGAEEVEVRKQPVELYTRPASPSIKFGIQVMPATVRVSQEMLKRNTVPTSEVAKAEFQEIRSMTSETKMFTSTTTRVEENGRVSEITRVSVEERSDLDQVDRIRRIVDELENSLKYFHGTKGDDEYRELHQKLVQNLAKLENIETQDNPVTKQEKKILMQRVQELIKILEQISEPSPKVNGAVEDFENSVGTTI